MKKEQINLSDTTKLMDDYHKVFRTIVSSRQLTILDQEGTLESCRRYIDIFVRKWSKVHPALMDDIIGVLNKEFEELKEYYADLQKEMDIYRERQRDIAKQNKIKRERS